MSPEGRPNPAENVTGTVTLMLVAESVEVAFAMFTVHNEFDSEFPGTPMVNPEVPPSHPVPASSINRIPPLMRLYSTRQLPVAMKLTTLGVGRNSMYPR